MPVVNSAVLAPFRNQCMCLCLRVVKNLGISQLLQMISQPCCAAPGWGVVRSGSAGKCTYRTPKRFFDLLS